MNAFYADIFQQPDALRRLAVFFGRDEGLAHLSCVPDPNAPILTGMGASFHAAWVATLHLHNSGIPATLIEAADLLNYAGSMLGRGGQIVFVSQSGSSVEVVPIIDSLPREAELLAVTNNPESPLAKRGQVVLPLKVDSEALVACKTYINSLAVLWLLVRRWAGAWDGGECDRLTLVAGEVEKLLENAGAISAHWFDILGEADQLLFLGHGPHAATARQAALTVGEWAKQPVLNSSVGAFRHGLIEIVQPGLGVVIFAPCGKTHQSAQALAAELRKYGARVLMIENGLTQEIAETAGQPMIRDEFLSPILDVIPVQLFADALRQHLAISPKFRYTGKVVTRL